MRSAIWLAGAITSHAGLDDDCTRPRGVLKEGGGGENAVTIVAIEAATFREGVEAGRNHTRHLERRLRLDDPRVTESLFDLREALLARGDERRTQDVRNAI